MTFLGGTCLAKALYDNLAETQEEISFKKGDIVTVIERDTNGLEGWWLCSLKGRKGIAPGNRLKILTGITQEPAVNASMASTTSIAQAQNQTKWRRSWDAQQNKVVVTPQKVGGVYVYEQGNTNKGQQDYDVPPNRYFEPSPTTASREVDSQPTYDTPPSQSARSSRASLEDQVYDVPPSQRSSYYDSPSNRSSGVSMMSAGSSMSGSASNTSFQSPNMCSSARSSSEINPQDIYDVPPAWGSDSQTHPSLQKKIPDLSYHTPTKSVDSGIYDTPPSAQKQNDINRYGGLKSYGGSLDTLKSQNLVDEHDYDVPSEGPSHINKSFGSRSSILDSDTYDVPHVNTPVGSNRSSFNDPNSVYDIPPQVTKDMPTTLRKSDSQGSMDNLDLRMRRLSTSSAGSDLPNIPYEELPYELDAAMDLLIKLQQDVHIATNRLLAFVSSTWRSRLNLENNVYNIKMCCERVASALKQFLDFGQGALANSARAADKKLIQKLYKALRPLQDYSNSIGLCLNELEKMEWQVSKLVQVITVPPGVGTDPLGQIVAVSTDIVGDARIVVSIVQGNSSLLFRRVGNVENKPPLPAPKPGVGMRSRGASMERALTPERRNSLQERPLPATPQEQRSQQSPPRSSDKPPLPPGTLARRSSKENIIDNNDYENDSRDWVDEYDYVQLHQGKEIGKQKVAAQNQQRTEEKTPVITEDKEKVEHSPYGSIGARKKQEMSPSGCLGSPSASQGQVNQAGLIPSDKQLLLFYCGQIVTHANVLNGAIDSFLNCIECNQPPKVFVAHSKFVVLNAHKMVYIGDTLHRNVIHAEIRNKIMHCANYLCETLKQTVVATKTAALQHPSVIAVQDMVDRVVDVSHAANEVKIVISQAAAL
ncbi:enhancer of filamentation 1-like isoform X2 [Lineus longissimus]|uniref:enhancer of filamentation 1-like isoform X2 n=1 Tax=Lineus longissimus TaxID=88925 RepID=UPI00315C8744